MRPVIAWLACCLALPASGQGLSIDWSFDVVRRADGRVIPMEYWISLPLRPDIEDVAVSTMGSGQCVGEPGGPVIGDGRIDSDDLICTFWTARADMANAGSLTVAWYDPETCTRVSRTGLAVLGRRTSIVGLRFDPEWDRGYMVIPRPSSGSSASPRNPVTVTGDDDPSWPGRTIRYAPTCAPGQVNCCAARAPRYEGLWVPWDVAYAETTEVLCGLEGVDWSDDIPDGTPDACWDDRNGNGRFDAGEPPTGLFDGEHRLTLFPINDRLGPQPAPWLTALTTFGRFHLSGYVWDIVPGDSYVILTSEGHVPTTWDPPRR